MTEQKNGVISENTKISLKLVITLCLAFGTIFGWQARMEIIKADSKTVESYVNADTSQSNRILDILTEMKKNQDAQRWNTVQLIEAWNEKFDGNIKYMEADDLIPRLKKEN